MQVFELGGEVVPDEMAQSLVRLLAEGSGQGNTEADAQLRAQAVHSHLRLLNRPNLPDTLLKVRTPRCIPAPFLPSLWAFQCDRLPAWPGFRLGTLGTSDNVKGCSLSARRRTERLSQPQCDAGTRDRARGYAPLPCAPTPMQMLFHGRGGRPWCMCSRGYARPGTGGARTCRADCRRKLIPHAALHPRQMVC